MNLFSSKHSHNKASTHNPLHVLQGLGHTPMTDWIAILLICVLVFIAIGIFATLQYMQASKHVGSLSTQITNSEVVQVKTREEKLRDIIDLYTQKKDRHLNLLGGAPVEVSADRKLDIASSTATTTSTTTSTNRNPVTPNAGTSSSSRP